MNPDDSTAVVRSYAKVNLTLDVLGKRPDGFHDIESVMQTISMHDTLTLGLGGEPGIRLTCDMPGIPTDESNLAHRAAVLFFEALGVELRLDVHVEKRIPPQAGLGGGSSNAAAVLRGLSQLFEQDEGSKFKVQSSKFNESETLNLEPSTLNHLAARIGSDVPFFLTGGTAFVRGRGEVVEPLPDVGPWWLVIVKPPFGISTAWAYQRLDGMRAAVSSQQSAVSELETASERIRKCIEAGDFRLLPRLLSNDLEAPAFERHPELPKLKDALADAGALGALMCGSGSAVFGLFDNKEAATRGAEHLGSFGESFVAKTISRFPGE